MISFKTHFAQKKLYFIFFHKCHAFIPAGAQENVLHSFFNTAPEKRTCFFLNDFNFVQVWTMCLCCTPNLRTRQSTQCRAKTTHIVLNAFVCPNFHSGVSRWLPGWKQAQQYLCCATVSSFRKLQDLKPVTVSSLWLP